MPFRIRPFVITGLFVFFTLSPVTALHNSFKNSRTHLRKRTRPAPPSDSLTIRYDAKGSTPIFIEGKTDAVSSPLLQKTSIATQNKTRSRSYLSKISRALRIRRPEEELTIIDNGNTAPSKTTHYRIRQHLRGIRVLGAEATLHLQGDRAALTGRLIPTPSVATTPTLSIKQAIARVTDDLRNTGVVFQNFTTAEQAILDYTVPSAELVVYPADMGDRLAYQVLIRPNMLDWWEYIVDAGTGELLLHYNRTCDAGDATVEALDLTGNDRTIHTWEADRYYLIDASRPMFDAEKSDIPDELTGAIVTYDYKNRYPAISRFELITSHDNTWDPKAVSAQYNSSLVYEYYRTVHNRNSLDGKGGSILSFINVADMDGGAMENAYWNGVGMYYGNGRRVFTSLVAALDVAGHEMTHGVVEATAGLRYIGQSGALNESFADVFGCMIERENWQMGETIVRDGVYRSGAMRDISDPHNGVSEGRDGWQPRTMKEYRTLPNTSAGDNGGVHVNSGIPNYAFYLFASEVGKEKAEKVYYRTLTEYLNASSQFADLRIASRLACEELYGEESTEAEALAAAFDSVGIFDDTKPFEPVADLQVNPGREYVLLTAAPPAKDGTTMYIADSAFGSLTPVSTRRVMPWARPSISDNGEKVLFVSEDKQLISITLNGTQATETILDSSKVWMRCAISRDGLRYAAVHDESDADTAIFIGSMNGGPLKKYHLNGPADGSSHAITGATMATALEWSLYGDNVVYDVYNSLPGPNGTALQNYNIGFLRGWNPETDSFGDGDVSRLFSNLGDGISVGNPTFSKNSPNIIAYELIDDLSYSVTVMTMNMENRKTVTVATTAFPGYPSFSKRDDRIAWSTIDGRDTVISVANLKDDKQTVDGDPTIAIRNMKWAIFFADGNRDFTPALQPAPARMRQIQPPGLTVLSHRNGLRALITGPENTSIRISIVRADGRIVHKETLFATGRSTTYTWNTHGAVAHGIYFIRMETPGGLVAKKFVLF